ncbi:MAG: PGPGW domain-containing protein [Candidatus Polarisedimenticolia bacterium]
MTFEEGKRRVWRLVRLSAGWGLTVGGLILMVMPGPGILLFLPGLALLSAESRTVRRWIRRWREQRLVRRALREAERVGFKLDPGPDDDDEDRPAASAG